MFLQIRIFYFYKKKNTTKKLRLKKGCSSQCQVFSAECRQHVDLLCLRPLFRFCLTNVVALPPNSFVTWCSHLLIEDIGLIPKSSDVQRLGRSFFSSRNWEGVLGRAFAGDACLLIRKVPL